MGRRPVSPLAAAALVAAPFLAAGGPAAKAQDGTTLRVFVGGQQRPEVMRELLQGFEEQHPNIDVEVEVGGATSEQQQQYLTTVLTSQDPAIDVMLIDVVRPAQYAAAGWAEPLDERLGEEKDELLGRYLDVYAEADQVDGTLYALPAFADAMFLYYRKDLLDEYGFEPPETWEELFQQAQRILEGENDPSLQGLSFQAAPIEGAVCTFLVPYWEAGGELAGADGGGAQIDEEAARRAFDLWLDAVNEYNVTPAGVAETATDDTRKTFQAGDAVFAVLWAYGWNHFQSEDSEVKGKVGVVPLPTFEGGGEPATCIGGWQWAMSAYSDDKEAAYELLRYLSTPEFSKGLALKASNLPVFPELYEDPEVLEANPWFDQALPVVQTARSRPVTPRYPEVSDTIRSNVNAVMAGIKEPEAAIEDMQARLGRVLR